MIVVSASMKKAGSGWYFNMTNDLLVAAGFADVRELRERYRLHAALQGGNCQVNRSRPFETARVFLPHLRGETFVVKSHGRPLPGVRGLLALGVMRATYIYRDPRDVVLSILDHGRRLRASGDRANDAAALRSVDDAVRYVRDLLGVWERWDACPGVLTVRYEDLVEAPLHELSRLAAFLDIKATRGVLADIVRGYEPGAQSDVDRHHLHFNKGVVRRFEGDMTQRERALCNQHFGMYLPRMGYAA